VVLKECFLTDLCDTDPCLNGATCEFSSGKQICHCISCFSGPRCATGKISSRNVTYIIQTSSPVTLCLKLLAGNHVHLSDEILGVHMANMYDHGVWGAIDTCPCGSYAAGIQLQVKHSIQYSTYATLLHGYYTIVSEKRTIFFRSMKKTATT